MKDIITTIQNHLKTTTGIQYIDDNWGQLSQEYYPNYPCKFPCVLVDIASVTYSDIGQNPLATPRSRQIGDTNIALHIAHLRLSNSSALAPQSQKDNAFSIFGLIQSIHEKMQGCRPTEQCSSMRRVSMRKVERNDRMQYYIVTYHTSIHNV